MTSIDLLNRTAHPDGWHDVRSPGGYEWWYFDAEDAATDTQIVAIFMQGFVFHPEYLRRYRRFIKNPTTTPPPVGADFPCVYLCVYRGGKVWKQSFTQYPGMSFRASSTGCDVEIGLDNVLQHRDSTYAVRLMGTPWRLTTRGPVRDVGETLVARFDFADRQGRFSRPAQARSFLSVEMTGAEHAWTIAAPRCEVSGKIDIGNESIDFRGTGYHDHNYGTAPIGDGLARWTWGRAFFGEDRVVTFHYAEPRDRSRPCETHLVEATSAGMRDVAVDRVVADWSLVSNPAMRLRYPRTLDFGPALRLSQPRVIDPSPFYLRLQFVAESYGETSMAFCEIAYPHRLRWPILGRMIEMSFDKRATL